MLASAKDTFFQAANSTIQYAKENPGAAAAMGTAGIMIAAPALVIAPAAAIAGFGANGIAAGSVAAGMHAGIGNIVAHSTFATLQSYGMAGYGVPIVHGIVQAAGVGLGAGAAYSEAKGDSKCDEKKSSDGGSNSKDSKRGKKL
ncbi:hypothetical protein SNK03_008568 [Fusarium graminearum]|uniref:Chromosome 4, complete genome n=2 Tax=Gibberella zeae TaxID=5518 RepID=A0A1C3YLE0_GIBZE|nr:hypothetical protein HG531_004125 [Fusarium graminearum]PCD40626.1 hypothetical protein FGRA07_01897 [Fusarium graminearum]CAF3444206.1 unnamed protein product [Fusarium graminearum]CAF3461195.1 unnamed protein product [Fusarium graminearum]CAF3616984.1 unnamed protein product [Fusarium graminearum]